MQEGFKHPIIIHPVLQAMHCLPAVCQSPSAIAASCSRPVTFSTAVCTGVGQSLAAATTGNKTPRPHVVLPRPLSHTCLSLLESRRWHHATRQRAPRRVTRGTGLASPRGTRPPARGCSARRPGPVLPPAAACAPAPALARPRADVGPPAGRTAVQLRSGQRYTQRQLCALNPPSFHLSRECRDGQAMGIHLGIGVTGIHRGLECKTTTVETRHLHRALPRGHGGAVHFKRWWFKPLCLTEYGVHSACAASLVVATLAVNVVSTLRKHMTLLKSDTAGSAFGVLAPASILAPASWRCLRRRRASRRSP